MTQTNFETNQSITSGTACPKCKTPWQRGNACAKCGLQVSMWAAYQPPAANPPAWLRERFEALMTNWDNAEAHRAMMAECSYRNELPEVARLYRDYLVHHPGDQRAQSGLESANKQVALTLTAATLQRPEVKKNSLKNKIYITIILLGLLAAMYIVYTLATQNTNQMKKVDKIVPAEQVPLPGNKP